MVKTYVIDTNVLIQNPRALDCFEDNQVVLPMVVLEELDKLKQAEGEKGANARSAIRFLEQTRHRGDLLEGVPLENGGVLRVEKNFVDVALPPDMPDHLMDNRILKVCKGLAEENGGPVVLVTKDILLRVKAQIIGIPAEDFTTEQANTRSSVTGDGRRSTPRRSCLKSLRRRGFPSARCTRPTRRENGLPRNSMKTNLW